MMDMRVKETHWDLRAPRDSNYDATKKHFALHFMIMQAYIEPIYILMHIIVCTQTSLGASHLPKPAKHLVH